MKLDKISVYQAIQVPTEKKINLNTISEEIIPGVKLVLHEHVVTVSHPDWLEDVLVFTANIRFAIIRKEVVKTFDKSDSVAPVSKPHRKNTKK